MSKQTPLVKLCNRGIKLYASEDYNKAEKIFREALTLTTKEASVLLYNIGLCQYSQHEYAPALETFKKIRESIPEEVLDNGLGLNEQCLCELHLGQTEEGMSHYIYRIIGGTVGFPELPIEFHRHNIEEFKDKDVLILNEQGLGDELMFARSIETLCKVAKTVHWQIYPENHRLFTECIKYDNLTFFTERSFDYKFLEKFNCWSSSGTVFSLTNGKEQLPPVSLTVEKKIVEPTTKYRVGFVFQTNKKSPNCSERSVDPEIFRCLSDNFQIELYNLQKDIDVDFANNIMKDITDTYDSAQIFASMDVILTIDTFAVHLAASLGKRTHLITKEYIDWRWKNNLYPRVTLTDEKFPFFFEDMLYFWTRLGNSLKADLITGKENKS